MEEKTYTVSEITGIIKRSLEENPDFNDIWVKGEISNLTYHSSGHIYLSLKDKDAIISAVFFKYANKKLPMRLEEGMSIIAFGSINVFEKRGSYQLILKDVRLEGIGELLKKIEQLKKKLLAEGVFDVSNKKQLPGFPRRLGIVTSPTGAAVRDIIKVAMRRFPNLEIVIAPASVQGQGAPESIVQGIRELNKPVYGIDVIIAGRGGGSFEDLMSFNEEIVVRAFYESRVPIISAVGHQIDHPLSDDAADYAAPTPSAAAEIAVPVKEDILKHVDRLAERSYNVLCSRIREMKAEIQGISSLRVFRNPMEIIEGKILLLGDVENRLASSMKDKINSMKSRLLELPDLYMMIRNFIREKGHKFNIAAQGLVKLSPAAVLGRGYSIAADTEGNIIRSITGLRAGDQFNLILADGSVNSSVNYIKEGAQFGKEEENTGKTGSDI